MISVQNLNKKFGKLEVLKNISLTFNDSRITALAGPNGSGKTTLIKSLLGLVKPDSGNILIDGIDIEKDFIYRDRIGYMPQIGRYPDNLSISDIINMIKDIRSNQNDEIQNDLIDVFDMRGHLSKKMSTLSGGTRQKVSAIISLMFNSDILILDEPTTGLDPVSAAALKEKIQYEKKKGKTIILISHIMSEVAELADDLIFLLDGTILFHDSVRNILEQTSELNLEKAVAIRTMDYHKYENF